MEIAEKTQVQQPANKSVQTVLFEIENQLKLLKGVVYNFVEGDFLNENKPDEAFLGVHNCLCDIEMKIAAVSENDDLDKIPVPGIVGKW